MMRKSLIVFHGMKRSGNHAVINWILSGGIFAFHNNVLPFNRYRGVGKRSYRVRSLLFSLAEARSGRLFAPRRIISVEDVRIDEPVFTDLTGSETNVLLLRRPENLFASRIRKASKSTKLAYSTQRSDLERSLALWKEHAREFLGVTNHLPNKIGIEFDRWVADPSYRAELAARLEIEPDDKSMARKAKQGGGSSFDLQPDGVLDRASLLTEAERELLERALEDAEIDSLVSRLEQLAVPPVRSVRRTTRE